MITQLGNKLLSSFLLFVDHEILNRGSGYNNYVSQFYPVTSFISGTSIYTSPVKPLCNDTSITGCNVLSGVYLNGNYITVGQSGLQHINHYQGALYFTGINLKNPVISGATARKEFNVQITDQTEWKVLFKTEYTTNNLRPDLANSGLALDTKTTPAIFIRYKGEENKPFGFSKLDNQMTYLRLIVVADTEFEKIAVNSVLKNLNWRSFNLIQSTPFDYMGNFTGVNYNYGTLPLDTSLTPIIMGVKVMDVLQEGEYKNILKNMSMIDFQISVVGQT